MTRPNNGMQRSADTQAFIFGKGVARPLMPGVRWLTTSDRFEMKLILATTIFSFSLLTPQSASAVSERCVRKVESDCYYVVEEEYEGLKEFAFFWTGDAKGDGHLSISGKAYINGAFIDLTGVLKNNRLSFVTSVSQGFTYKFVGRFIPGGKPVKDGRIHILGIMVKLKGGRKIVSRKVEFFVGSGYNT